MNVFPLSAANSCRCFFLLTICMQLSMWINGDWRVAESGWCKVINQHNECRWARCRWSPHSGLCRPAGSLCFPLLLLNVWLHVSTTLSLPRSIPWLISAIFFYPLEIFRQLKKKKKVLVQFFFKSTVWNWMWHDKVELSIRNRSSSVFRFMEGRCHPRSTRKLATFKKHNHLRTCNKSREMGKWPYCQLAKDKWKALICEFTCFLHSCINTCFCLSPQSFDGASIDMNMDTDSDFYFHQKMC